LSWRRCLHKIRRHAASEGGDGIALRAAYELDAIVAVVEIVELAPATEMPLPASYEAASALG
jgi:hypothetical protein